MNRNHLALFVMASFLCLLVSFSSNVVVMDEASGYIEYYLNVQVAVDDGITQLPDATVYMNNGTDFVEPVVCGAYGCWANYTDISTASVTLSVKWQGNWVYGNATQDTTTDHNVTLTAKVYQNYALTWRFNGNATAFTPTQVKVTAPNGTSLTLSSYTLGKVQNGTWTVTSVTYGGKNVVSSTHPTFTPTADSQTRQIACRVYSTVISASEFKDSGGAA